MVQILSQCLQKCPTREEMENRSYSVIMSVDMFNFFASWLLKSDVFTKFALRMI